jgi:phenylacetate-CoA ligase
LADRFYDAQETRAPADRAAEQFAALRQQIAHAKQQAPAYASLLAEVDPAAVTDRAALAQLPLTHKATLIERQQAEPPFGGLAALTPGALKHVFMSPGPIYEPEAGTGDFWRAGRALYAAGFRAGDLVHNSFAYHLTPGGWILDSGARSLGCAVVPAGIGNTEQQVQAIAHLQPVGYTGTPDFLKTLLDKAAELGLDAGSINKALVSGAALPPSLRQELQGRGVATLQCYATADLGLIAYESEAIEGMIVDEGVIVEIVRPGTSDPVPDGEVGEVVVSTLNPDYPLIRFATGDLSAVLAGASPCGRTGMRLKGWMGRADQTTKVRGMFVHPQQVAEIVRRHPEVARARLVVSREGEADAMTLHCEAAGDDALGQAIGETIREVCKVRGTVAWAAPGSLPNDGKVIEDARALP